MRFSLKHKTMVLIILIAVILSGASLVCSRLIIDRTMTDHYGVKALEISRAVASELDPQKVYDLTCEVSKIYEKADNKVLSTEWGSSDFNAYIDLFEDVSQTPEFIDLRDHMRRIQDVVDVDSIYLVYIDGVRKNVIYVADAALEDACPPGCIDPLYEINYDVINDPSRGFPPFVTDTAEYGWLVSAAAPVYYNDEVAAYVAADVSMKMIRQTQNRLFFICAGILIAITVIMCFIGISLVNRLIVKPINSLSDMARKYCEEEEQVMRHQFASLKIYTGDEIEDLAESMKHMEHEINQNLSHLESVNRELKYTRHQAEKANDLANRDALTGVRNRRAYDSEIRKFEDAIQHGTASFGIAIADGNSLKEINDSFGRERGNRAIKNLCSAVCSVFVHSPVFRIGGDEFAVILENNDLEHIEELEKIFEDKMSEASSSSDDENGVTAAFGYAIYDKDTDMFTEDVFKRASRNMKEKKEKMKRS